MTHRIKTDELENIWFTADNHFGHENIIKFCDRPFESVEEMDRVLIENWNKVVRPTDAVYHLSDFTLGWVLEAKRYFRQLNGHIKVLSNLWHHDKRWLQDIERVSDFDKIGVLDISESSSTHYYNLVEILPPLVVLEIEGMGSSEGRPLAITLCHYPLAVWDRKHYGAWHLCAHTHKHIESGDFILNVGVDCQNYYPISFGGVLQYMYEMGW